jgi:hypothetical protein
MGAAAFVDAEMLARLDESQDHQCCPDPPPLKWSDLRYVFDIKEDCNGKEAIQA